MRANIQESPTQLSSEKRSKEFTPRRSFSKYSKEDGLSVQKKLRRFASWKGFARSQKTQQEIQEELLSESRNQGDEKTSVRRKRLFALVGLRRKESQRIPVREVEPPRLSDTTHAHCEIVDVRELQHKIKIRQKQLRTISDWLCRASVVAVILSLTITVLECYAAHLENIVQKAAALQISKQWKSQCGRRKLQRIVYGNTYEETDCQIPSISTADWSAWSICVRGKKTRWKIMERNKRYVFDIAYHESRKC
ncbi:hypothetical protein RB195_002445 [Necator americanus]|uniref:Uncharacterized protein n=1 Tax=Necator americanus TaxID=51031 RepID=A0ABR1DJE2_NECAM